MAGALTNFLWTTAKSILAPAPAVSTSPSSSDNDSSHDSSDDSLDDDESSDASSSSDDDEGGFSTPSPGDSSTTSSSHGHVAAESRPHKETPPPPDPPLNSKPNPVGYNNHTAGEKEEQKYRQDVGDQQQQQQQQGRQQHGDLEILLGRGGGRSVDGNGCRGGGSSNGGRKKRALDNTPELGHDDGTTRPDDGDDDDVGGDKHLLPPVCLACAAQDAADDAAVQRGALEGCQRCRPIWITPEEYARDAQISIQGASGRVTSPAAAAVDGEDAQQQRYCDLHPRAVDLLLTEVSEKRKDKDKDNSGGGGGGGGGGGPLLGGCCAAPTEIVGGLQRAEDANSDDEGEEEEEEEEKEEGGGQAERKEKDRSVITVLKNNFEKAVRDLTHGTKQTPEANKAAAAAGEGEGGGREERKHDGGGGDGRPVLPKERDRTAVGQPRLSGLEAAKAKCEEASRAVKAAVQVGLEGFEKPRCCPQGEIVRAKIAGAPRHERWAIRCASKAQARKVLGWLREGKGWSGVAQMGAEATSNMLAEILQASLDVNNADWKDKGWKGPTLSNHREARFRQERGELQRSGAEMQLSSSPSLLELQNELELDAVFHQLSDFIMSMDNHQNDEPLLLPELRLKKEKQPQCSGTTPASAAERSVLHRDFLDTVAQESVQGQQREQQDDGLLLHVQKWLQDAEKGELRLRERFQYLQETEERAQHPAQLQQGAKDHGATPPPSSSSSPPSAAASAASTVRSVPPRQPKSPPEGSKRSTASTMAARGTTTASGEEHQQQQQQQSADDVARWDEVDAHPARKKFLSEFLTVLQEAMPSSISPDFFLKTSRGSGVLCAAWEHALLRDSATAEAFLDTSTLRARLQRCVLREPETIAEWIVETVVKEAQTALNGGGDHQSTTRDSSEEMLSAVTALQKYAQAAQKARACSPPDSGWGKKPLKCARARETGNNDAEQARRVATAVTSPAERPAAVAKAATVPTKKPAAAAAAAKMAVAPTKKTAAAKKAAMVPTTKPAVAPAKVAVAPIKKLAAAEKAAVIPKVKPATTANTATVAEQNRAAATTTTAAAAAADPTELAAAQQATAELSSAAAAAVVAETNTEIRPPLSRAERRAAEREKVKETAKAAKAAKAERLEQDLLSKQKRNDPKSLEDRLMAEGSSQQPETRKTKPKNKKEAKPATPDKPATPAMEVKQGKRVSFAAPDGGGGGAGDTSAPDVKRAAESRVQAGSKSIAAAVRGSPIGHHSNAASPSIVGTSSHKYPPSTAAAAAAASSRLSPPSVKHTSKSFATAPAQLSATEAKARPAARSGATPVASGAALTDRHAETATLSAAVGGPAPALAVVARESTARAVSSSSSSPSSSNGGGWMWPSASVAPCGSGNRGGNGKVFRGGSTVGGGEVKVPAAAAASVPIRRFLWIGRATAAAGEKAEALQWGNWKRWREPDKWEKMVAAAITRYPGTGVQCECNLQAADAS